MIETNIISLNKLKGLKKQSIVLATHNKGKISEINKRLPTEGDLTTHLSTIFTENRLKKYIVTLFFCLSFFLFLPKKKHL